MELYTLNLGQFSTGSPAERAAIAQAFDGAFRTAGFCYLTGYEHLLPEATIDSLRAQSTAFFALPAAEKEKSRVDGERRLRTAAISRAAVTNASPSAKYLSMVDGRLASTPYILIARSGSSNDIQ